jgi:hypothetical protein
MQIAISDSKINPDKQTSEAVCFRGLFFVPTSGSKVFFVVPAFADTGFLLRRKVTNF